MGKLRGAPGDPPGLPRGSSGELRGALGDPFLDSHLDIHGCLWDALGPPMDESSLSGFWDYFLSSFYDFLKFSKIHHF